MYEVLLYPPPGSGWQGLHGADRRVGFGPYPLAQDFHERLRLGVALGGRDRVMPSRPWVDLGCFQHPHLSQVRFEGEPCCDSILGIIVEILAFGEDRKSGLFAMRRLKQIDRVESRVEVDPRPCAYDERGERVLIAVGDDAPDRRARIKIHVSRAYANSFSR